MDASTRKPPQLELTDKPAHPRLQAVVALEERLRVQRSGKWRRAAVGLFAAAGLYFAYRWYTAEDPAAQPERFATAKLELRHIVETVESSGKLRPVKEVQVGTQVSGRVVEVHVDFNSPVKKGDLLAEIDPSLFGAQVHLVTGQLDAAKAQLKRAMASRDATTRTSKRMEGLLQEAVVSEVEVENALSAAEVAQADVVAARAQIQGLTAQLRSANTTLAYTKIYSPIDGLVINRAVDPGQTVASSFAAPVLFVIAQDLKEMQVLADIDEADVGKVKEGMSASVTVDAFPGEKFKGNVTQLRFSPTEVQGVVTYAAVLDVSNDHLKLRPGMTATVSIVAHEAEKTLAVPNAALRFKPAQQKGKAPGGKDGGSALRFEQRRLYQVSPDAPTAPPEADASEQNQAPALTHSVAEVGFSDGQWTQLLQTDLAEGAEVVTRENSPKNKARRKFLGIF